MDLKDLLELTINIYFLNTSSFKHTYWIESAPG